MNPILVLCLNIRFVYLILLNSLLICLSSILQHTRTSMLIFNDTEYKQRTVITDMQNYISACLIDYSVPMRECLVNFITKFICTLLFTKVELDNLHVLRQQPWKCRGIYHVSLWLTVYFILLHSLVCVTALYKDPFKKCISQVLLAIFNMF